MANEKLIKSMMACNGTNAVCAGCAFRDMPECRNAMAHHAGALIQLQDVVIANSSAQAGYLKEQIKAEHKGYEQAVEVVKKQREVLLQIENGLREARHCESCLFVNALEDPEVEKAREEHCKACQESVVSGWQRNPDWGKEEEYTDPDELEEDE